eukprot:TRINITY_DN3966_c0_g1_i1.p1 TRINITY_DN3966_c0_g1~~TRINITY_DN3966_c0_g1_i1.p1  ORF type:complete len:205 (-),score=20.06 TRINITY_DN3966_c0_g1_i1:713-1327(-)
MSRRTMLSFVGTQEHEIGLPVLRRLPLNLVDRRIHSQSPAFLSTATALPKPPTTFWQSFKKQKGPLGNAALALSCGFLAARMMKQERELQDLQNNHEAAEETLREENKQLKKILEGLKQIVSEEIEGSYGRYGYQSKDLARRIELEIGSFSRTGGSVDLRPPLSAPVAIKSSPSGTPSFIPAPPSQRPSPSLQEESPSKKRFWV